MPINFVYANDKIYFHGAKNGYKIDAINKFNKVSLCVVDKDYVVEEELTTYITHVYVSIRLLLYLSYVLSRFQYRTGKEAIELTRKRG